MATTLGELFGFAVPALVDGGFAWLTRNSSGTLWDIAMLGVATVAGLGEGAVLAFAQWLVLRLYIPELNRRRWVLFTALAASLAWFIGMLPSTLIPIIGLKPSSLASSPFGIPVMLAIALLALLAAAAFLLSIGVAQWLELRRHVPRAWRWIVANAIAWPIGVMIPVVTISLVPDTSPTWAFIVSGLIGGVLMGVVVGIITGLFLLHLIKNHTKG